VAIQVGGYYLSAWRSRVFVASVCGAGTKRIYALPFETSELTHCLMGVDPLALHQPAATLDEITLLIQIVAARGKGAAFVHTHTLQVQPTRFSAFADTEREMICLCAKAHARVSFRYGYLHILTRCSALALKLLYKGVIIVILLNLPRVKITIQLCRKRARVTQKTKLCLHGAAAFSNYTYKKGERPLPNI
jgi:hypothetical protein